MIDKPEWLKVTPVKFSHISGKQTGVWKISFYLHDDKVDRPFRMGWVDVALFDGKAIIDWMELAHREMHRYGTPSVEWQERFAITLQYAVEFGRSMEQGR